MLPLLLSVPHAGLDVPAEAEPYCILTRDDIIRDGDEGAAEIYDLKSKVAAFQTSSVARAIVDLNRSEDDRRPDGVVKTLTCWNVPVYRGLLPERVIDALLSRYYHPYHARLCELGRTKKYKVAIDCHTMAAAAPPIGSDVGTERPWICLSNGGGTCPDAWIGFLQKIFKESLDGAVTINDPFKGGYITRQHAAEMPWLQLEMSRQPFMSNTDKRALIHSALGELARYIERHPIA
jgi:N-formylglutamate deformylase